MKNFITAEEKSILSSLDSSRILDIKTESNFILFGLGIGFDLWILEHSFTPFIMYHQTKASLRSCKPVNWSGSTNSGFDWSQCRFNPDDIIKVSDQSFSGFAFGTRMQGSLVFLQTDNWRISMENSFFNINTNIQYKGLNYYSNLNTSTRLICSGEVTVYDENGENGKEMDDECINVRGEDMSSSADYMMGLQITYYFR